MSDQQFFLGRQPIVGRQRELIAYELLFRGGKENAAAIFDDVAASAFVIQHVFTDLGVHSALGDKRGFINLSEGLLMSGLVEMLPRDRVVLEILETVPLTADVVARCRQLRNAGYTLALDDVTDLTEARKHALPYISFVKVDVLQMRIPAIAAVVEKLRPYHVSLLAEKIDSESLYETCFGLGFDLFQGYFFAKPVILSGRSVHPSAIVLMKLFALTAGDADIDEIETLLKQAPDLTLRLLKMANSAGFSPRNKISGVRNAILVLGRVQINRLTQIMMFAQRSGVSMTSDPLLQTAVVRGRVMEGIAAASGWPGIKDRAFMVGMLSLVDALFGETLASVVELLNLEDSVKTALLEREGELGMLLELVEAIEMADAARARPAMKQLGLSNLDQLNQVQIEALSWAGRL